MLYDDGSLLTDAKKANEKIINKSNTTNNGFCLNNINFIYNNHNNTKFTKIDIKNNLLECYKKLINEYNIDEEQILNILKYQKKDNLVISLEDTKIKIEDLILNDNYFISNNLIKMNFHEKLNLDLKSL